MILGYLDPWAEGWSKVEGCRVSVVRPGSLQPDVGQSRV